MFKFTVQRDQQQSTLLTLAAGNPTI